MSIQKIILILTVVLAVAVIFIYNGIVIKQEMVTVKWQQLENQLKTRNDLIPKLVNIVKGHGFYEKKLLENIADARSQWGKAMAIDEKITAAEQIDTALSNFVLAVENYPGLKDSGFFLSFMDELTAVEDSITVDKTRYNEAVRDYNTAVQIFPGNIISNIFGFKPAKEYFMVQKEAGGFLKVNL